MGLQMCDVIALSKSNLKTNVLELIDVNDDTVYSTLVGQGYISNVGKLTDVGIKTVKIIKAGEDRLKSGILIKERKKSDVGDIKKLDYKWVSKPVKYGKKSIQVTLCAVCVYKGKYVPELPDTKEDESRFEDKKIIESLNPTDKLQEGVPYKYQIQKLDGYRVVWIKLKNDIVAIQSCYYDLITGIFTNAKFYGVSKSHHVYVKIKNDIVATIAHVNTKNEMTSL